VKQRSQAALSLNGKLRVIQSISQSFITSSRNKKNLNWPDPQGVGRGEWVALTDLPRSAMEVQGGWLQWLLTGLCIVPNRLELASVQPGEGKTVGALDTLKNRRASFDTRVSSFGVSGKQFLEFLNQRLLQLGYKYNCINSLSHLAHSTVDSIRTDIPGRSGQVMDITSWVPVLDLKSRVASINTKTAISNNKRVFASGRVIYNSTIRDYFNLVKGSIYTAQHVSTIFFTASWLLEAIRGELGMRNANIRRVLNQTFLLTQQPLFNRSLHHQNKFPQFDTVGKADSHQDGVNSTTSNLPPAYFDTTTVIPDLIKGLRITFSGRMGGKKGMAKTLTKTVGRVPLSTLREKVDFAKGVVHTKTGSLGVKVWICYHDTSPFTRITAGQASPIIRATRN